MLGNLVILLGWKRGTGSPQPLGRERESCANPSSSKRRNGKEHEQTEKCFWAKPAPALVKSHPLKEKS